MFTSLHHPSLRALVLPGYEERLATLAWDAAAACEAWVGGGRARHPLVTLPDGVKAVVREYRRGGAMRHLNRKRYFLGHRALAELRATERARAAGVRVPEVLAATERRRGVGYEAWLATRWVEGAGALGGAGRWGRGVAGEVGRQIGLLHRGGVGHPDLNLNNFLVVTGPDGEPVVYIIDFDRATLYAGPVPRGRRARDLRRLARSARKLRAEISPEEWKALREGYGADWPLRSDLG